MNDWLPYYLGFSFCYGIGPLKFKLLKARLKNIREAYEAPKDILGELLGSHLAEKFLAFRSKFDYEKVIKKINEKNIKVIVQEDAAFPEALRNISDPPICLYVRGDISLLVADSVTREYSSRCEVLRPAPQSASRANPSHFVPPATIFFAIVGTRKPTSYGIQVAKKFAGELANAGFIIVSGMAMGIDTIAHRAALDAGQKTIAILGCGVDIIYPAVNTSLYWEIIKSGGVILSEFPPGHTVLPGLFIARNRLISGLSRGVLVAEGLEDSGSLITARYAAEQGKDVFAPPSPITSAMSAAPNLLIKEGARLVTSVEDIMAEFGLKMSPRKKQEITVNLPNEEKNIFDLLEATAKTTDEIIEQSHLAVESVLNTLSLLELKGAVEKNSEGKYQIKI